MFDIQPKVYAHKSAVEKGNFVLHEFILHKISEQNVKLFRRYCPHRMYPLHEPGETVNEITCKFHNFKWNSEGMPINNDKMLSCGNANINASGIIASNFVEPNHSWVNDLHSEPNLQFSHCYSGKSNGNWLWMMDIQADLLHIQKNGIHPELSLFGVGNL